LNYLVDTHYFIWSLLDTGKMGAKAREALADSLTIKYVSKITLWEISLKYSLGKLQLKGLIPEKLVDIGTEAGYEILDVSAEDVISYYKFPLHKSHRDPFDRLLIWQCIRNDLVLISADERVKDYSKHGLKLV
jgi:PIN domain nuclease of toxin-antitoxin system